MSNPTSTTAARPWLLVSGDFVRTGGQDRSNHAVALYLANRGDEVHLVAHRASADLTDRPNVVLHRAAKPLNSYFLSGPLLDRLGRKTARSLASRNVRVLVNGGNCDWPDVNWVHYVHAAWKPTPSGNMARRIKAVMAHHHAMHQERSRIGRARLVIANSERTKRDLIEHVNIDPEKIRTIYLGADVERFHPVDEAERAEARKALGWRDDRQAVVFVGAMGDRRKGFDTLYEAWRILASESSWDARLVVVGAGASLEAWKSRALDEGFSNSIEFLGFRSDMPQILAACDVLVSPVRYEAYGLNVHEALCCGLPALASAASGVAEQFPPSLADLLLPDPEDSVDLANRLREWRSRPGTFRVAVIPVSERLRARSWETVAGELVEAIENA